MRKVRGAVVVLAVVAAGIWASPTASAARKPDLVVRAVRVAPDANFAQLPHVVMKPDGMSQEIFVSYTVKNVGRATARNVSLNVLFQAQTESLLSIPKIAPGVRKHRSGTVFLPLTSVGIHPFNVCADPLNLIAESNETNNCNQLGEVRVLAERWLVERFSITTNNNGAVDKSEMTDFMAFTYIDHVSGRFRYKVEGQVTQSVSGSQPGSPCSYSGSTPYTHYPWVEDSVFEIDYDLDTYYAKVWDPSEAFTWTQTCPSNTYTYTYPTRALTTYFGSESMNPYDSDIATTYTVGTPTAGQVWDWRFIADIPYPPV